MAVDMVIAAIGQVPESSVGIFSGKPVTFDPDTGSSSVSGLFGAGDFVRKASTVIEAIGSGRRVAETVDEYLLHRRRRRPMVSVTSAENTHRQRNWDFIPRHPMNIIDLEDRLKSQEAEVETGFSTETGIEAASRCYLCNLKYQIHIPDCIYCRWCIDVCPRNCIELIETTNPDHPSRIDAGRITRFWNRTAGVVIDSDRCIRCGECYRVCPTRCIHITRVSLQDRNLSRETP